EAALTALFGVRNEVYGQSGLVSALWNSSLSVGSVTRNGDQVDIQLDGSLALVGVCADARMEAQIIRTVFQFPAINRARIMVRNQNLKQSFDGSGTLGADYVYTRAGL